MDKDQNNQLWDEVAYQFFAWKAGRYWRSSKHGVGKIAITSNDLDKLIEWCRSTGMGKVYRNNTDPPTWRWEVGGKQGVWTFVEMVKQRIHTFCPKASRAWMARAIYQIEERIAQTRNRRQSFGEYTGWKSPNVVYEPEYVPETETRTVSAADVPWDEREGPVMGLCGRCGKQHEVGTIEDIIAKRFRCEQVTEKGGGEST